MLLVILLAGVFIVMEADHDCEGEDCPVCECLEQCQTALHQTGNTPVICITAYFSVLLLITGQILPVKVTLKDTPVSTKVRLND